jgi:serine protease
VTARDAHSASTSRGAGNLKYHGGPVEHTNTTYAIYWVPSGYSNQLGYSTVLNQFFTDVGTDSGKTTNVYYTGTQYSDGSGNVQYNSSFGGSYTDTSPLPASGCKDSDTSVCLTDAQEQAEITKDIAAAGWSAGSNKEFFLFTAKGIGSCISSSSSQCAFTYYCAYHSWIGSGSSETLYANMPYADTVPSACGTGQKPNGNDADDTINVTSHEHNETITDENGNAWYDSAGYEDGDKCAWIFGAANGTNGAEYNQTINGHNYYLQEEYSNRDRTCIQKGL